MKTSHPDLLDGFIMTALSGWRMTGRTELGAGYPTRENIRRDLLFSQNFYRLLASASRRWQSGKRSNATLTTLIAEWECWAVIRRAA